MKFQVKGYKICKPKDECIQWKLQYLLKWNGGAWFKKNTKFSLSTSDFENFQ